MDEADQAVNGSVFPIFSPGLGVFPGIDHVDGVVSLEEEVGGEDDGGASQQQSNNEDAHGQLFVSLRNIEIIGSSSSILDVVSPGVGKDRSSEESNASDGEVNAQRKWVNGQMEDDED